MGLFSALFGSYSKRQLKKLEPIADAIEMRADRYAEMSDAELAGMTEVLRGRLANGETLNDILPDAFATVREADARVLGKRPFHVQLLGGIVLHQGRIAEMKTGEGKTLVATLPAYLNALTGKGVHIVTVNDYLARRDSEEMGRVYAFLGLTTGLVVHGMSHEEKVAAYAADITYGTNNEYGFDYLRDNMAVQREGIVQRGHAFAIIDEVDSILIDEARTPLIISGAGQESSDLYEKADKFARKLKALVIKETDDKVEMEDVDEDYIVDEKARTTVLTKHGVKKAEAFFGVDNLSDGDGADISSYINQAIRAHGIMHRDDDYVVRDGQVIIVDSFTGRLMPGRRYNGGLHQAIEAKEGVKVERENRTLASITFQNYFRMYGKLSGMTGTALTEENEFREIYRLDVVEIPTNRPMIRKDHNDMVFSTLRGKYTAIIRRIKECQAKGQPVLVGTVTIEKSEFLSKLLSQNGIKHTVLNAKHHEREAEIVAQAGQVGAVTISTNMAGRGTDILLGGNPEFMAKNEMRRRGIEEYLIAEVTGSADTKDEALIEARALYHELFEKYKREIEPNAQRVREAGGLFILGTERHESRRIDNQLRGRSGRQGDPGESCFYLSLEDDLMRLFGGNRMQGLVTRIRIPEDEPITAGMLTGGIRSAQQKLENRNFSRRKHVLTYDDVMNQQREIIYSQRRRVLNGENIQELIVSMITDFISDTVQMHTTEQNPAEWNLDLLRAALPECLTTDRDFNYTDDERRHLTREELTEELTERAMRIYREKDTLMPDGRMREAERYFLLRAVDINWTEHIDAMEELKESIGLNAYAQRDPVNEYRMLGAQQFEEMIASIKEATVRRVLGYQPTTILQRMRAATRIQAGFAGDHRRRPASPATPAKDVRQPIRNTARVVGPNDDCPCGSGKKYKKCCGMSSQ